MSGAWDGVPLNPERDGWHWVQRNDGKYTAMLWVAQRQWYESPHYDGDVLRPSRVANPRANWTYHGPCLTPAEHAAALDATWKAACEAMREKAAHTAERVAREQGRADCCGYGVGGHPCAPECCGDPLYLIADRQVASAIRNLPTPERPR